MRLWSRALFLACLLLALMFTVSAGLVWLHDQVEQVEPVPSGFEAPVRPALDPSWVVQTA
jgi:hypothetical protein